MAAKANGLLICGTADWPPRPLTHLVRTLHSKRTSLISIHVTGVFRLKYGRIHRQASFKGGPQHRHKPESGSCWITVTISHRPGSVAPTALADFKSSLN